MSIAVTPAIVPMVALLSATKRLLANSREENRETFWIDCPEVEVDRPFLKRMG